MNSTYVQWPMTTGYVGYTIYIQEWTRVMYPIYPVANHTQLQYTIFKSYRHCKRTFVKAKGQCQAVNDIHVYHGLIGSIPKWTTYSYHLLGDVRSKGKRWRNIFEIQLQSCYLFIYRCFGLHLIAVSCENQTSNLLLIVFVLES